MLLVEVTPQAAAQIERATVWWTENRLAAPDAIADDFEEAKNLLTRQPGIGARSSSRKYPDLRRLFLSRVRYHISHLLQRRAREGHYSCVLAFGSRGRAKSLIQTGAEHCVQYRSL